MTCSPCWTRRSSGVLLFWALVPPLAALPLCEERDLPLFTSLIDRGRENSPPAPRLPALALGPPACFHINGTVILLPMAAGSLPAGRPQRPYPSNGRSGSKWGMALATSPPRPPGVALACLLALLPVLVCTQDSTPVSPGTCPPDSGRAPPMPRRHLCAPLWLPLPPRPTARVSPSCPLLNVPLGGVPHCRGRMRCLGAGRVRVFEVSWRAPLCCVGLRAYVLWCVRSADVECGAGEPREHHIAGGVDRHRRHEPAVHSGCKHAPCHLLRRVCDGGHVIPAWWGLPE